MCLNIPESSFSDVGVAVHRPSSRHFMLAFPGGGKVTIIDPPIGADVSNCRNALGNLLAFTEKAGAVISDKHLSEEGKKQRLQAMALTDGLKAKNLMERHAEKAAAAARTAEQNEREFYAVPAREPGDAVSVAEDQIVLTYLTGLSGEALRVAQEAILAGDQPRHVLALQRMGELVPLPHSFGQITPVAWRTSVDKANPDRAAAIADSLSIAAWEAQTMNAIMAHAPVIPETRQPF